MNSKKNTKLYKRGNIISRFCNWLSSIGKSKKPERATAFTVIACYNTKTGIRLVLDNGTSISISESILERILPFREKVYSVDDIDTITKTETFSSSEVKLKMKDGKEFIKPFRSYKEANMSSYNMRASQNTHIYDFDGSGEIE